MKKIILLITAIIITGCSKNESDYTSSKDKQIDTSQCTSDTTITKIVYRPLRQGILKKMPSDTGNVVINETYKKNFGKEEPIEIGGSEKVLEQCTLNKFSFISIYEGHRKGISGWVESAILKTKIDPNNPYEGKIAEYLYDKRSSDYLDGASKLKGLKLDIQALEIKAAEKVIDSKKCEYVDGSMIDFQSSPNNIHILVYCGDKQFTLSKDEVDTASSLIKSDDEKSLSKEQSIDLCKLMIRESVVVKESVNTHDLLGTSFYKAINGNVAVSIDFDVKNKLGAKFKYSAKCLFPVNEKPEITIRNR